MRFYGKQYGLWAALLLTLLRLHGQQPYYYNVQQYGPDDGFKPYQVTNAVTGDRDGFIWIGTDNGLYQFDGKFFKQYIHRAGDSTSLPSSLVQYNYQDRQGRYWVYVYTKGLYNFLPATGTFKKFRATNEAAFNIHQYETGLPFEDSRGRLWFPVLGYGIARYDASTDQLYPYKICFPGNCGAYRSASWITRILEDTADNSFWLCSNRGLVHFNPATGHQEVFFDGAFKNKKTGEDGTFIAACTDAEHNIWLGTWSQGIKKFDPKAKSFQTWLPAPGFLMGTKNICGGIAVRDNNSLWVSSIDGGMLVFNTRTGLFHRVAGIGQQSFNTATSFYNTANGAVWFCSGKKLYKLNPAENLFPFHPVTVAGQPGNNKSQVSCFAGSGRKLYAGVYYNGRFYEYNLQTSAIKAYALPGGKSDYAVNGLAQDAAGHIWMATGSGLYVFDTSTRRILQPPVSGGNRIGLGAWCSGVAVDKEGIVWVSTMEGLVQYQPLTKQMRLYKGTAAKNAELLTVACGSDGHVWVGAGSLGLGCLKKGDSVITYFNRHRNPAYPQFNCTSIAFTGNGAVLFTQRGEGLYLLEQPFTTRETMVHYTAEAALPSDFVNGVLVDRQGRVWVYSSAGISLLNLASRSSITFSKKEGLMETAYESNPWQDEEGFLYVGSTEGFQRFHPDSILKQAPVTSRIHFSDFRVNGHSWIMQPGEANTALPLRLGPGEGNISFRFAALTTSFSNMIRYAYRLKGYDKEWIETDKNDVTYNNLPPGSYELQVKTGMLNQTWNTDVFALPVIVARPWYRQAWFIILCVAVAAALMYGLYRFRINALRQQLRLKTAYDKKISEIEMKALRAQMNPHFIFNCLNSINRYIVKSDEKTASGYLTKFSKLIRLILDNAAAEAIPVEKEVETLRLYIDMEALRFDHVFSYSVEVEPELLNGDTEIPSMLVQPYVENAIWHGLLHVENRKGMLKISFSKNGGNDVLVTVEDNGIGREKAAELKTKDTLKRKSYGMQITSDRLQLINNLYNTDAKAEIEDLYDAQGRPAGTRVRIRIPVKQS